ncbi:MAG: endonuclease/exonuclease/phosphatase family protein [Clostridia bacterium]|nr:endonuclease/exonuclease/phosphatase family protein [Clostridia bacterium]
MKTRRIVTFNIRCPWVDDGINSLPHRLGAILDKLDREQPDVVCFQEVIEKTAEFFRRHVPDYFVLYNGRCENYDGEGLMTLLRRDTVELLSSDFFWLSPTPYVPASRFEEQSDCPRVTQALMLRFCGETQPFWVYNNHLDHISDRARILGIQQILARVSDDQERCEAPVFILGDFNAKPDSETIRYCDTYQKFSIINATKDIGTTFHNFGKWIEYRPDGNRPDGPQIDYIYVDTDTASKPYTVTKWTDEQDGVYLSDHYPICLQLNN